MKPAVKKWMPAAVIPAVIAALGVGAGISASASPQLEPKTPEQVIELMAGSDVQAFSGQFGTSTRLGIPELPDAGAPASFEPPQGAPSSADTASPKAGGTTQGSASDAGDAGLARVLNLVSGSHEARVYVDGADKARLQVLEDMEEQDVILNGTSLWTYDSAANEAVHATLPASPSEARKTLKARHGGEATRDLPTPGQLADTFLSAADATTSVSVQEGSTVAGRAVYNLVLTPKTDETLVGDVTIGVDAATGVPLAVTVDADGQDAPAINVAFTSFTPKAPDDKLFEFTPPADATVHEQKAPTGTTWPKHTFGTKAQRGDGSPGTQHRKSQTGRNPFKESEWLDGEGWNAVATIPKDQVPAELKDSALVKQLATTVDGGKLLHTSLVNVLIADDGRVLVGSVPLERLQSVADAG